MRFTPLNRTAGGGPMSMCPICGVCGFSGKAGITSHMKTHRREHDVSLANSWIDGQRSRGMRGPANLEEHVDLLLDAAGNREQLLRVLQNFCRTWGVGYRSSRSQLLTEAPAYNMDTLFRLPAPSSSGVGTRAVLADTSSNFRRDLGSALEAELQLSASSDEEEQEEEGGKDKDKAQKK